MLGYRTNSPSNSTACFVFTILTDLCVSSAEFRLRFAGRFDFGRVRYSCRTSIVQPLSVGYGTTAHKAPSVCVLSSLDNFAYFVCSCCSCVRKRKIFSRNAAWSQPRSVKFLAGNTYRSQRYDTIKLASISFSSVVARINRRYMSSATRDAQNGQIWYWLHG